MLFFSSVQLDERVGIHSFRCEHEIFSENLKRDPSCHEAAPELFESYDTKGRVTILCTETINWATLFFISMVRYLMI